MAIEDNPTQWVDVATVATWLCVGERHVRKLLADGVLPKRRRKLYDLQGCVRGYVRHLQGLVRHSGNGEKPVGEVDEQDPDLMPVELRLKYWQSVRQRQASQEHLAEIAEELAAEYHRQAGEAVRTIREAIEAAGLPPETLDAIRAAVSKAAPP